MSTLDHSNVGPFLTDIDVGMKSIWKVTHHMKRKNQIQGSFRNRNSNGALRKGNNDKIALQVIDRIITGSRMEIIMQD